MTQQYKDRDSNRPGSKSDNDPDDDRMIGREDFGSAKGSGVPEQTTKAVGSGNV